MKKLLKTATAVVLMLCMVFSSAIMAVPEKGISASIIAHAESIVDSGTYDNITWSIDEEYTLTISGNGAISSPSDGSTVPWHGYKRRIQKVVFEGKITSVGGSLFPQSIFVNEKYVFNTVIFCDSIKRIEDGVFNQHANIQNIDWPDSLEYIGGNAFLGASITSAVFPDSLEEIGGQAFTSSQLREVTLGRNVKKVDSCAFSSCNSLYKIIIFNPDCILCDDEWTIGAGTFNDTSCTIYGYNDSTAEAYANKYNRAFISLGDYNIVNNPNFKTDEWIIEEVKKYTSSEEIQQLTNIYQTYNEEDFKKMSEFFINEGLTDVFWMYHHSLTEAAPYAARYEFITNNDVFCANNLYNWVIGTGKKGLLDSMGLVYNLEFFDYPLAMVGVTDFPGIKKSKAVLMNIMGTELNNTTSSKFLNACKDSCKAIQNLYKINNIVYEGEQNLLQQFKNCSSVEGRRLLAHEHLKKFFAATEGNETVKFIFSDKTSSALGLTNAVFTFTSSEFDAITRLFTIDEEVSMYCEYKDFLEEIANSNDISLEMRLAAQDLVNVIYVQWLDPLKDILRAAVKFTDGIGQLKKDVLDDLFGEAFNTDIAAFKLEVWLSNLIIGTDDFVKETNYTLAYAELSAHYAEKLKNDKAIFRSNPSVENAWQFYADYSILWKLRDLGEESYININSVSFLFTKLKTYDYEIREKTANEIRNTLLLCKFDIPPYVTIPDSVKYANKIVVNCPVDVYVYLQDGTLIATLKDGVVSDITNEYGRFAVVYQPYDGEYAKVICQNTDEPFVLKASAFDDGLVNVVSNTQDNQTYLSLDNVIVQDGDEIVISDNYSSYSIDYHGDGTLDVNDKMTEHLSPEVMPVESINVNYSTITLYVGESLTIQPSILPDNASCKYINWFSMDDEIAIVRNGVVKAQAEGITTIHLCAIGGDNIVKVIPVIVLSAEHSSNLYFCTDTGCAMTIRTENSEDEDSIILYNSEDPDEPDSVPVPTGTVLIVTAEAKPGFKLVDDPSGRITVNSDTEIKATSEAQIVPAVTGLLLEIIGTGEISLIWNTSDDVDGYNIYRSETQDGEYAKIASTTETTYTDEGLTVGKTYYYKVATYVTADGKEYPGALSEPVSCTLEQALLTGVEGFIYRLYKVCLDRDPDAGGLSHWVEELTSGRQTGAQVAYNFVFSNEFKKKNLCNEHFIKQLYVAIMGRDADEDGLNHWLGQMKNGMIREAVFNNFTTSREFNNICSSYGINAGSGIALPQYGTVPTGPCSVCGEKDNVTQFVERMYTEVLGRNPDAAGLQDWTTRLWNHTATGRSVAGSFIFSNEYIRKNTSNDAYVRMLYKTMMNRDADTGGLNDWLNRLRNGSSRQDVFNSFVSSNEFNKICNNYGITRG